MLGLYSFINDKSDFFIKWAKYWRSIFSMSSAIPSIMAIDMASVQFSHSIVSDFLQPHGLRHARIPCPSPTPGAYSNSCPSSRWCCPNIASSVIPFSFCPKYFPVSGSFTVTHLFASGGQNTGVSALASALPINIQDWFPLGLTGLISFLSKGLSRVCSSSTVQRHQFFGTQPFLLSSSHIVHDYWENHKFDLHAPL